MSHEHRRDQKVQTGFAVLVVSDTRTEQTDKSGKIAMEMLKAEGHSIIAYDIVRNRDDEIRNAINKYLADSKIRVIITSGGTGPGVRDRTVEVLENMFDRRFDGFGEHFRRISYEEIGLPAIYSRSIAGIIGNTIAYCLPGSKNAMRTALEKVILPSIGHLLWEVDR